MKRSQACIVYFILLITCLNADQQQSIVASTQQKVPPKSAEPLINGWNHIPYNPSTDAPFSTNDHSLLLHNINLEQHTQPVNVKNSEYEVEPIFKQLEAPSKIVDKELVNEILNLTTAKPETQPSKTPQPASNPQKEDAKVNESSKPKSIEAENQKQKPEGQAVFSGAMVTPVNTSLSPSTKQREKQVAIEQITQMFGNVEEYDTTSDILNITNKRFISRRNISAQLAKHTPTPQQNKQVYNPTKQATKIPTQPAKANQPIQPTKPVEKVNIANKESTSTLQPTSPNDVKSTPKAQQKDIDIKPVIQNIGRVEEDYDITSSILGLPDNRFIKKTRRQHNEKSKPTELPKQTLPSSQPQSPKENPIRPKEQTQKSLTSDIIPTRGFPDVIDTRTPKQEKKDDEFEGSKNLVLKICSLVIVGIAIVKYIQWRKSYSISEMYEDRQQDRVDFISIGQETQLQLDPDQKDEEEEALEI